MKNSIVINKLGVVFRNKNGAQNFKIAIRLNTMHINM